MAINVVPALALSPSAIAGVCLIFLLAGCDQSEDAIESVTQQTQDQGSSTNSLDNNDVSMDQLSEQIDNQLSALSKRPGTDDRPHGAYDPHKALTPEQHIKVALQHKAEGRMPHAIEALTQALASQGENLQLLVIRSSLLLESGHLSEALRDLNAALMLAPREAGLLVNRAEIYRQFGRAEDALADLDQAVSVDDKMVAAYFNRGTLHYQNGDHQLALQDFSRCIEIDPHIAGPYFNRAAVFDVLGQQEEALADIRHFMDLTENEGWRKKAKELLQTWDNSTVDEGTTQEQATNDS